jgi:hypothetical protein
LRERKQTASEVRAFSGVIGTLMGVALHRPIAIFSQSELDSHFVLIVWLCDRAAIQTANGADSRAAICVCSALDQSPRFLEFAIHFSLVSGAFPFGGPE